MRIKDTHHLGQGAPGASAGQKRHLVWRDVGKRQRTGAQWRLGLEWLESGPLSFCLWRWQLTQVSGPVCTYWCFDLGKDLN
jgi:hypothetical protein